MTAGVQTFILLVALKTYGFTVGPFGSYAECDASRAVVAAQLDTAKWPYRAFCLPGTVEEKR